MNAYTIGGIATLAKIMDCTPSEALEAAVAYAVVQSNNPDERRKLEISIMLLREIENVRKEEEDELPRDCVSA